MPEITLIGHVGVDSGQLLLCDPCYIDSEWTKEDFKDVRIYQNRKTGEKLQFMVDFLNFQEVIPAYDKNMNELKATGEWELLERPEPEKPFSYNGCCNATLSPEGHGQLNYKLGHPGVGVAFSTAFGDGYYPVYAVYGDDGHLQKVEVVFYEDGEDQE